MNKSGAIVIIEDDFDDSELLRDVFSELNFKNETVYFSDAGDAFNYLTDPGNRPFLILSDIRLQRISGFELKEKLQQNTQFTSKCVPYLFITTTTYDQAIFEAYAKSVQGFFLKPSNFEKLRDTVRRIVEYWQECIPSWCADLEVSIQERA